MVCLEGLGALAQKFPNIASTSIYCLRDFLITPSPILSKLHRQANEKGNKENLKIPCKYIFYFTKELIILHCYMLSSLFEYCKQIIESK